MDILNPHLVWVGGRCYRKLPIRDSPQTGHEESIPSKSSGLQPNRDNDFEDTDLPIKHEKDIFYIVIPVPTVFLGVIKGKRHATKTQIENSCGVELRIPNSKKEDGTEDEEIEITVIGKARGAVARGYYRIDHIVQDVRGRMDYTHFISIPMNDKNIQENFLNFKRDVLRNCRGSRGVRDGIFLHPENLHLTIVMLTLFTNREKEEAAALLQKCRAEIVEKLEGKPLRIEVKGLEYMNDDPEDVTTLYGKVKEDKNNCLQIISNMLDAAFCNGPYARRPPSDDANNVKLHVTLMSAKQGERGYRETFDATQILEKYGDYTFGQTTVSEVHVSVRYTAGEGHYYTPFYVLKLL